jgi:hypothetical protein
MSGFCCLGGGVVRGFLGAVACVPHPSVYTSALHEASQMVVWSLTMTISTYGHEQKTDIINCRTEQYR